MTTLTVQPNRIAQYWALTKPRVTQLAVFCAVIGMFLATPELPDWRLLISATVGIWLLAGAAFAVNCLVEREIDSRMARTARRPMADLRHLCRLCGHLHYHPQASDATEYCYRRFIRRHATCTGLGSDCQ
jgi:hypothetical protein